MIDLFDQQPDPGQEVPDWLRDLLDAMTDPVFRERFIEQLRSM